MFGLALPEPNEPLTFGVLPDNVEVLSWFFRMQTQWRVGMNGLIGMNYGLFLQWSKDEGIKRKDRVWMLEDLRLMEREYLDAMRPVE